MNVPPRDPCGVAILDACEQAGIPRVRFNTGETFTSGANFFQVNRKPDGTRSSSSVSYLHPILERENLTILTDTWAKELEFDAQNACTRLLGTYNAYGSTTRIGADTEVTVSSGAINTPQLRMLSGIGPAEHLREVGIEVRAHSPGVGENLADHPEGVIQWGAKRPLVTDSTQWWEIGIFTTTAHGRDRPVRP